MTLGELIEALEAADPTRTVRHGFTHPHSYRGYYNELAFEPASNVTVADMLADARSALYATYEGWKGGDFTMSGDTDCWLSGEGCASGDTISALLLELMLGSVAVEEPAASAPDTLPAWLYQRFAVIHGCASWDQIDDGQRAYWEHQARAVRRAVARGGFKAVAPDAASEVTSAPLSASQPSGVSESAQSPTGAATGRLGDLPSTEDLASADNPTHLRWGLGDVQWGDDDSVIVMLSGPDREAYWLELDPERAGVLREDLAGPPAVETHIVADGSNDPEHIDDCPGCDTTAR